MSTSDGRSSDELETQVRFLESEITELRRRLEADAGTLDPLSRRLYEIYDLFPFPDPSHAGEYVPFAHEMAGPEFIHWGIGAVARRLNAAVTDREYTVEGRPNQPNYELRCREEARRIQEAATGSEPLPPDLTRPTGELAVPIICDIELDRRRTHLAANVPNRGRAIANLPEDAIVEVPISVDARGVHPVPVGPLPPGVAGLCHLQISIQDLLVEAYREGSRRLLLQALLLEPTVDSPARAEAMMETMLRLQAGFLPPLR